MTTCESGLTCNSGQSCQTGDTNPPQYTITYDANGGSVYPSSVTVAAGTPVALPTPSYPGHTFYGWYLSGGTLIAGNSYTVTANVTLYAQWSEPITKTYYIAFQNDGDMLSINGQNLSISRFDTSPNGTKSIRKWIFEEVPNEEYAYIIRPETASGLCLTANYTSVSLQPYTIGNANQYWKPQYNSSSNFVLNLWSTNFNLTKAFGLSSTGAPVGLFELPFIPYTSLDYNNITITVGSEIHLPNPVYIPSSPNAIGSNWEYYTTSNENICNVDSDGKLQGYDIGIVLITIVNKITGVSGTCVVKVIDLVYPDTLITYQPTRDTLLRLLQYKDETDYAYTNGLINIDAKNKAHEELNYQMNLARADYIITDTNPTSNYAYIVLGGNSSNQNSSLGRSIYLNETNPLQGLDIMVIQRCMELCGLLEFSSEEKYGTWDNQTHIAALDCMGLLSIGQNDRREFDDASFYMLFNGISDITQRTYDAIRLLQQFNIMHTMVQNKCLSILINSGLNANKEIRMYYPSGNYGRADLLASTLGGTYLWEVKHNTPQNITRGITQVNKYINLVNQCINQDPMTGNDFYLPLITGPSTFPKMAIPYGDKYIIFESYINTTNPYSNALIIYKKLDEVPYGYVLESEIVSVDVPVYQPSYSFNLGMVYNTSSQYGNALVDAFHIDPETGKILVAIIVAGAFVYITLDTLVKFGLILL